MARISEAKRQLQQELDRGRRVHGGEATLAELSRDYQVNRDIYQDLLRRRENARVSMNLDTEQQGLTVKIQEPATLPLRPSGLRFLHFIIIGLVFGVMLPLGLVFTKVYVDPRVRIGMLISDKHKQPLLAVVPHLWSPSDTQVARREIAWLSLAVSAMAIVIVVAGVMRAIKVI
jgi:hypothetical protein